MVGLYGQGGFPLAQTLAQPVRPPMRKQQVDTSLDLGMPSAINRQIERRAARFLEMQTSQPNVVATMRGVDAEMRERADRFARTQEKRYGSRPR